MVSNLLRFGSVRKKLNEERGEKKEEKPFNDIKIYSMISVRGESGEAEINFHKIKSFFPCFIEISNIKSQNNFQVAPSFDTPPAVRESKRKFYYLWISLSM